MFALMQHMLWELCVSVGNSLASNVPAVTDKATAVLNARNKTGLATNISAMKSLPRERGGDGEENQRTWRESIQGDLYHH